MAAAGQLGLLLAAILSVRLLCVVLLIYHADDNAWRWHVDGQVRSSSECTAHPFTPQGYLHACFYARVLVGCTNVVPIHARPRML